MGLDFSGDLPPTLDLNLAIGDRTRDVTSSTDREPITDDKLALELAAYLSLLNRRITFEVSAFGDLHLTAIVKGSIEAALHHQPIAGSDIARKGNPMSHDHGARFSWFT